MGMFLARLSAVYHFGMSIRLSMMNSRQPEHAHPQVRDTLVLIGISGPAISERISFFYHFKTGVIYHIKQSKA